MLQLLVVFAALSQALQYKRQSSQHDKTCMLFERAYTGVRIQYERGAQIYPLHYHEKHLVITKCDLGEVVYELELPVNATLFNRDIAVPERSEVLRFSRRKAYQHSNKLWYISQTLVGAVYERDDSADVWTPLSPLVADLWFTKYLHSKTHNGKYEVVLRTPLLRSPDVLERNYPFSDAWTSLVSPNEEAADV